MRKEILSSPYLDGRRQWEELMGSIRDSRDRWRLTAIFSLVIVAISVLGITYIGANKEVMPYIVEVDRTGAILNMAAAKQEDASLKKNVLINQIGVFTKSFRNVVLDAKQQRDNVYQCYSYLRENSPAHTKLTNYFRDNDPFKRAQSETVNIEVTAPLELQENVYEVEWTEKIMDRKTGQTTSSHHYKMVLYFSTSQPNNANELMKNPLGLIIKDLNWTKE